MTDKKKSTIFYWDWLDSTFEYMTDDEVGKVCRALLRADAYGTMPTEEELPTDNRALQMAFRRMLADVVRNREKYEEECQRRADNKAMDWWMDKNPEERTKFEEWKARNPRGDRVEYYRMMNPNYKCIQVYTHVTDKETDTDNDKDTDNDTDTDKEKDKERGVGETIRENQALEDIRRYIDSKGISSDVIPIESLENLISEPNWKSSADILIQFYQFKHDRGYSESI